MGARGRAIDRAPVGREGEHRLGRAERVHDDAGYRGACRTGGDGVIVPGDPHDRAAGVGQATVDDADRLVRREHRTEQGAGDPDGREQFLIPVAGERLAGCGQAIGAAAPRERVVGREAPGEGGGDEVGGEGPASAVGQALSHELGPAQQGQLGGEGCTCACVQPRGVEVTRERETSACVAAAIPPDEGSARAAARVDEGAGLGHGGDADQGDRARAGGEGVRCRGECGRDEGRGVEAGDAATRHGQLAHATSVERDDRRLDVAAADVDPHRPNG
ncbi:hypothetical protein GCM10025869_15630 [Homoserinibacter gongjuensis]|uniref:Uncharacterized protein n=1 Tax=Homoserinibacter gongjuensis TaxID=1162968 RepID=A0ABQ6JSS2_9MICO|nr:hypothetical protein [Homoserinibacter gongjuensis]GMA91034.1 hypothetical protein GCM10025869_15630 [Homoserinibacter gongjuensis]